MNNYLPSPTNSFIVDLIQVGLKRNRTYALIHKLRLSNFTYTVRSYVQNLKRSGRVHRIITGLVAGSSICLKSRKRLAFGSKSSSPVREPN